MAEIELKVLNGQCLSIWIQLKKVKCDVAAWQKNKNNKNSKINWQFTIKDARIKLKNFISQLKCDMTLIYRMLLPLNKLYSFQSMLNEPQKLHTRCSRGGNNERHLINIGINTMGVEASLLAGP